MKQMMYCLRNLIPKTGVLVISSLVFLSFSGSVYAVDVNEQMEKAKELYRQTKRQHDYTPIEVSYEHEPAEKVDEIAWKEFFVYRIQLQGDKRFSFLKPLLSSYENKGMSTQRLQELVKRANQKLVESGYVTTRITVLPQNINKGVVILTIIPGTIRHFIWDEHTARIHWETAFPSKDGDVLNIRDLEQGLENLRHAYGQDVRMKIVPNGKESDIVLYGVHKKLWVMSTSINNSGTGETGKIRGQLDVVVGNLLGINDTLSFNWGGKLERLEQHKGYHHYSFLYSVPYRNYMFSYRYHQSSTKQPLKVGTYSYPYVNRIHGQEVTIKKMKYRDEKTKVQFFLSLETYEKHNFVNQTELMVQRIKKTAIKVGAMYERYRKGSQLSGKVSLTKGVSWLGAQADEAYGGAFSTHGWIGNLDITYTKQIHWNRRDVRYRILFHGQQASSLLSGADEIAIGGLYTVRGFTGTQVISGKSGWYMQQEWQTVGSKIKPYVGLDVGQIHGDSLINKGKTLAGMVIGVRGEQRIFFDIAIATPLIRPATWKRDSLVGYIEAGIRI